MRFMIEHATKDQKHEMFPKHIILDIATRFPGSALAMVRGFDCFYAIYPLPVWDEAFSRAFAK
jgi:hypothetical protein